MPSQFCVTILCAAFVFQFSEGSFFNELPDVLDGDGILSNVKPRGCFQLNKTSEYAPFKRIYFSKRYTKEELKNEDPVSICTDQASLKNVRLFGVQMFPVNGKKKRIICRRGIKRKQRFLEHSVDCKDGYGGPKSIYVYKGMKESPGVNQCEYNGKTYNEGDTMRIPNNYSQIMPDAICMTCKCVSGRPGGCTPYRYCESEMNGLHDCEKHSVAPGDCCPSCECVNKGKVIEQGREWVVVKKQGAMNTCSVFKCLENGRAEMKSHNYLFCDCKVRKKTSCCKAMCESR